MEISQQTKEELSLEEKIRYDEWNKKINDIALEIMGMFKDKQLNVNDSNEVIKVIQVILADKVARLNINYLLNN